MLKVNGPNKRKLLKELKQLVKVEEFLSEIFPTLPQKMISHLCFPNTGHCQKQLFPLIKIPGSTKVLLLSPLWCLNMRWQPSRLWMVHLSWEDYYIYYLLNRRKSWKIVRVMGNQAQILKSKKKSLNHKPKLGTVLFHQVCFISFKM